MSFFDHGRDHRLGNDKRCVQIHIDDLSELCCGHLAHRNTLDDAGIVYQNVDHADLFFDLCNQCVYLLLICDIANISVRLDAKLLISGKSLVDKLLLDVVEYDRCARLRICRCDCESDAVGCACYKRYFSL